MILDLFYSAVVHVNLWLMERVSALDIAAAYAQSYELRQMARGFASDASFIWSVVDVNFLYDAITLLVVIWFTALLIRAVVSWLPKKD